MSAKVLLDDGIVGVPKSLTVQTPLALLGYRALEVREACQILILSEDFSTYERAAEVCRRMQSQLGEDLEFGFKCWNFFELADPDSARAVLREAKLADVILFSISSVDLPAAVVEWLEALPTFRSRAEGALALVLNAPMESVAGNQLAMWLDQSARRMGMDFLKLTHSPVHLKALPALFVPPGEYAGSREWDHWGLNE